MTNIAINGAAGRMGQRLIALGSEDPRYRIVDAIEYPEHPAMGKDAGRIAGVDDIGVLLTSALSGAVQAVIDFSVPQAAENITRQCIGNGVPLVMATTGLTESQNKLIQRASETIAVVQAPNMSLAVNIVMKLAETVGGALKNHSSGVDVEIIERHHRGKKDAPSGTALKFGDLIAATMGQTTHTHGREGIVGERPQHEIAYHAVRVGDNPGEHNIIFGMIGETIELSVSATNRDAYALGALAAAEFVAKQPPGLYSMYDVLGL